MRAHVNLETAVEEILTARRRVPPSQAALVAVSGIHASGKGYITARLTDVLQQRGFRVANINIDSWLNLPHARFSQVNAAEHFYRHAIRFDEMFEKLIAPLQSSRSIDLTMDYAEEIAPQFSKRRIDYKNIDIILLEGIYLLKREFETRYDFSLWVDCSFQSAMERAVGRAQEGLPPQSTIEAYQRIYFPAQEIHFKRDNPKAAARLTMVNDRRLES